MKHDPQGSYCLLQGKDLAGSSAFSTDALLRLAPAGSSHKYLISSQDVLFQARGYSNQAFYIEVAPEGVMAAATFYILKVRTARLLPAYLAWFLNQRPAQNYFQTHANTSTAVSYVSKEVLLNLDITLPDLETQARIQAIQAAWMHEKHLLKSYLETKEVLIQESCLSALSHPIKEKRK